MVETLKDAETDPSWLTFELTELLMAEDASILLPIFDRLRAMGVGLSVDDFGSGYSSLRYLERFPLTEVKIDKHFVSGMAASPANRGIVAAVINLGRELSLDVVAEGIEIREELDLLQSMRCPIGQGYLFGKPVDEEEFRSLVLKEDRVDPQ